jgi:alpha-mannosidase
LFTEPVLYRGASCSSGLLAVESAPTLVAAWAVPAGADRWVLRLHEMGGVPGRAVLRLAPGWTVRPCSLDGKVEKADMPLTNSVAFRPYEIVSVCLSCEPTVS